MKKIIFFLLTIIANVAFAQVDSSTVKINVSIQARDLEYIAAIIPYSEEFEDAYDAAKSKFRVGNPPTGNANVSIDSVTVGTWFKIDNMLQKDYLAISASVFSRIDAILRAKNNQWLTGKLNWFVADGTNYYNNLRALGRKRLLKK